MRRLSLCLAAAVAALVAAPVAFADGPPLLVTQGGAGVASPGDAFHYVAVPSGADGTLLEKIEHGEVFWWMRLPGSWGTATIGIGAETGQGLSRDGRTLVLASPSGPLGSSTSFLVVDPGRARIVRTIRLPGSFSFDALSPDGSRMYLIEYTYAASSDLTDYVVRAYDMRANRLLPRPIAARDEDGDEKTMAGYAISRATSAGGRWVYTLYQKPSGAPFVHALDTVAGVARCIDLPSTSAVDENLSNMVVSLRDHDRTLAVDWRTGRPWLRVAVGSWRISRPGTAGFPWAWVGAGVGAGLVLLAAGVLVRRRRRHEELEQHAGQELGLA